MKCENHRFKAVQNTVLSNCCNFISLSILGPGQRTERPGFDSLRQSETLSLLQSDYARFGAQPASYLKGNDGSFPGSGG
jgi:hypothetical protein